MNSSTQAVLPAPLSTALRQKLGERAWSQRKLAAFLGRNESTVSLWLSGRQTPRSEDTQVTSKLAKFLDTIPEHVHELIALQKDPDAPPSVRRQITKWNDFQLLLRNNAFVRRAMDLRLSRTSAAGLRDRLLEQGYDVAAEVLEEYRRGLSAKMPSSNGRRSSRRHAGVGSRTRAANFADSTESREVLRQACRELNALFVRANNAVDERDAEACLRAACSQAAGPTSAEDAANRILDELVRLHLVRRHDAKLIRRWPLNADFVLNSLWGVRSGITNFDFLLDGGWLSPADNGLVILVKGRAGRGKTMFALQTAASVAAQGELSIYFTAEESATQLLARLSYAGFGRMSENGGWGTLRTPNGSELDCFSSNDFDAKDAALIKERRSQTGGGCLFLVEVPERKGLFGPSSRLLLQLESLLDNGPEINKCALLVFDSLDALDSQLDRRALEKVVGFTKRPRTIGLFVSELPEGRPQDSWRDHLVDMVIRFDVRERLKGFGERVIEIEKCRTQSHIRGEHMFAIHGNRGMTVYPSIQSLLSIWRGRIRRPGVEPCVPWSIPGLDFDAVMNGDIVRGSTVLLTGPPHTHRSLLGLSFLAAGLEADPASHVILVSLREDPVAIHRIIQNYRQLDPLLDPTDRDALNPRLRVLHFAPDYFSAERFLHWLQRSFREYQDSNIAVSRILFSSINQLLHNSPMFPLEKLFIDALLELFKRKEVTSLFLGSESAQNAEIANAFDVILFTGFQRQSGLEQVTVRVGHSGPCNADGDTFIIRRERRGERVWLSLEKPRSKSSR